MLRLSMLSMLLSSTLVACDTGKADADPDTGDNGTTDSGGPDGEDDVCDVNVTVFDYDDQGGWTTDAPDCGGTRQSPVDLQRDGFVDADAPVLDVQSGATPVHIIHNGHSIEFEVEDGAGVLGIDGVDWSLAQFHFHTPSEHTVDGENLPGEMHLVHTNGSDIAVLGVFLVDDGDSAWLTDAGWADLPTAAGECFASDDTIDLGDLIDGILINETNDMVHYTGSLTTPPCTEGVQWFLPGSVLSVSPDQLAALTARFDGNNRDTQPLGDRTVVYDVALAE